MKRELLLVFGVALIAQSLFSASLEELVGTERAAALCAADEPITEVQIKTPVLCLLPKHAELETAVVAIQNSLEPAILVETLSRYHKPSTAAWNETEQTSLLNQLVALSSLTGIQYYSASRKAMRVFYESSCVIDNPTEKKPLPDPVYAALPASFVLYARQKDLTFGDNIYSFSFHTGKDFIYFVQENLTAMNAGIIPAIGKNKFHCLMAIIDTEDSLLIYTAAMSKAASIPGMGDRIGASFSNRVKAILTWFEDRADLTIRSH